MFDLSQLSINPENPSKATASEMKDLITKIEKYPKFLELRPIVYDPETMIILGGNKRFKALIELGIKEVPESYVKSADMLTEQEKRNFIFADNMNYGSWDIEFIDEEEADEWLIEFPDDDSNIPENYSRKIQSPIYEPRDKKPLIDDLFDQTRSKELIKNIESSKTLSQEEKDFLIAAAHRHTVFNYSKIADFFAHSGKQVQELMQDSALVIIDFEDALEKGFVKLTKDILKTFKRNNVNE